MPRRYRLAIVVVVALAVFGYRHFAPGRDAPDAAAARALAEPAPVRRLGRIAFRPCSITPPMGAASVEAQCGTFEVPEDPARPRGRRIALNIAWFPASESGDHLPDPVFMLAGGPGQSATDSFAAYVPALQDVVRHRDLVLVDQRGTGKSNPLQCALDEEDGLADATSSAADAEPSAEALRAETIACRDALSKKADLRFYTTTDAVRDLDAVRAAIGAEQVNLYGVSYGSRVAQQYAMRHPRRTRTLVLDGVAPNAIHLGNDFARNLETALDLQFGRCGETPACARALGDPRERLDALMATLRDEAPLVAYRDASTGEAREERLRPGHVAGLARMYAYAPAAASILPLLLHEASEGRYAQLMALSKMLGGAMRESMMYGMQLSVICTEDAAGMRADAAMSRSLLGNQLVELMRAQCGVWPKGTMPADFHQPLASRVPTLLLSGELDPVTPPAYAEMVARTLPESRSLVLRGQGHSVLGTGCTPKLYAQFLQTADAKSLDAGCLDALAYTPPFTSFNGWEP